MPYYAGYAGIVRININNGIPVLTWDVPGVTVVTATNINEFVKNGVLTLNRTGLKTLDLQKGALQGITNKAAVTKIIFGTDTAYNEEESRNKQGTGIDFTDQFKGFSNVTYLDFTGTQVGKVNPGDWNDLKNLKSITMPATIVNSYNLPGTWYFTNSANQNIYLSTGTTGNGSSRVYATTAVGTKVDVSGKTIYRDK